MRGTPLDKMLQELHRAELWALHEAAYTEASSWAAELRAYADRCVSARRDCLEAQDKARRDYQRWRYAKARGWPATRAAVQLPPAPEPDWDVAVAAS